VEEATAPLKELLEKTEAENVDLRNRLSSRKEELKDLLDRIGLLERENAGLGLKNS